MKHSKRIIGQLAILILLATLLLSQLGCAGEVVRALDYTLENELYDGQTDATPQTAEATPPAGTTLSAETTASPTEAATQSPTPTPSETSSPTVPDAATPVETEAVTGTPLPSQTPELHRLRVFVQDAAAAPLVGARVTLFQDGTVMLSGMTGSDGNVSWTLPIGHSYVVKAALSGYQVSDGEGKTMT